MLVIQHFQYTCCPLVILLEITGLVSIVLLMILISTRPDETSKLSKLTVCVKNVKDWMTNNFLLLNSDKIEILFIGPKNSTQNLLDYNLQLDRCTVTSSTVKSLGVILDSNLSFENHISHVTKQHSSILEILPSYGTCKLFLLQKS